MLMPAGRSNLAGFSSSNRLALHSLYFIPGWFTALCQSRCDSRSLSLCMVQKPREDSAFWYLRGISLRQEIRVRAPRISCGEVEATESRPLLSASACACGEVSLPWDQGASGMTVTMSQVLRIIRYKWAPAEQVAGKSPG